MASTQPFPVATRQIPVPYLDPFSAHHHLAQRLGAQQVYLLESLAGPAIDRQAALVGVAPVLLLQVADGHLSLQGVDALVDRATQAAISHRCVSRTSAGLELTNRKALWELLRAVQGCFDTSHADGQSRFSFGFFGYFGYDTAWAVEDLPTLIAPNDDAVPDVCLALHQCTLRFDLEGGAAQLVVNTAEPWAQGSDELVGQIEQCLSQPPVPEANVPEVPTPIALRDCTDVDRYRATVPTCLEHIAAGDIYQVQLGHELTITSPVEPQVVYQRLRARNPSPYMYLTTLGNVTVIGASPELFVRICDGVITQRPIAGTAPRGKTAQEDGEIIDRLQNDEKERAEHVMLVDLCRNDIGRVCQVDSLRVTELMICERYSHVVHLVSNVDGRQRTDVDAYDVLAASFPAGTMTGAPKVRAMEIIESLETSRRGIYAGTLGVIDFGGYVNTALCIRTAVHHGDRYTIRASAGVVADSTPMGEWRETMHKLGASYWAITGEEVPIDYAGK